MKDVQTANSEMTKSPQYLLYNNLGIIMGVVMMMVRRHQKVNIAQLAIFLPLLLDDNIVKRVTSSLSYRIINIVAIDKVNIANMNDRYRHSLLLLVNALSVLQDFDAVRIVKDMVEYVPSNKIEGLLDENICHRLVKIKEVYKRLWPSQQEMELEELYHYLGIIL